MYRHAILPRRGYRADRTRSAAVERSLSGRYLDDGEATGGVRAAVRE